MLASSTDTYRTNDVLSLKKESASEGPHSNEMLLTSMDRLQTAS